VSFEKKTVEAETWPGRIMAVTEAEEDQEKELFLKNN
jgi:hypothetical protein